MTPTELSPPVAAALSPDSSSTRTQDDLYAAAFAQFGPALERLVRGYEHAWLRYVLASIFAVVFTLLGVWHTRRRAHDLQRELDALDALKRG